MNSSKMNYWIYVIIALLTLTSVIDIIESNKDLKLQLGNLENKIFKVYEKEIKLRFNNQIDYNELNLLYKFDNITNILNDVISTQKDQNLLLLLLMAFYMAAQIINSRFTDIMNNKIDNLNNVSIRRVEIIQEKILERISVCYNDLKNEIINDNLKEFKECMLERLGCLDTFDIKLDIIKQDIKKSYKSLIKHRINKF